MDMSETELRERTSYLKKRILTLEWDKKHNQLNAGMELKFEEMKKEFAELEEKLGSINQQKKEERTETEEKLEVGKPKPKPS
jgi:hypothetical protein